MKPLYFVIFRAPHCRCFSCHQFHFRILGCFQVFSAFHVQAHHSHSPGLMEVLEKEVNPPLVSCCLAFFYLLYLYPSNLVVLSFIFSFFYPPAFVLSTNHRAWTRLPWPMPPFWMAVGVGPTVPWLAPWALWLSVFLLSLLSLILSTPQRWAYKG